MSIGGKREGESLERGVKDWVGEKESKESSFRVMHVANILNDRSCVNTLQSRDHLVMIAKSVKVPTQMLSNLISEFKTQGHHRQLPTESTLPMLLGAPIARVFLTCFMGRANAGVGLSYIGPSFF